MSAPAIEHMACPSCGREDAFRGDWGVGCWEDGTWVPRARVATKLDALTTIYHFDCDHCRATSTAVVEGGQFVRWLAEG